MAAAKKNLVLLLDRPTEPTFTTKGKENTAFDVPPSFLTDEYKPLGVALSSRFGEEADNKVPIKEIPPPNLGDIPTLGRKETFSLFIPWHRKLAGKLINLFMKAKDITELQSVVAYARDRVNPYLFNYCFNVAILHRPDTKDVDIPTLVHYFPAKFIDSRAFNRAREELTVLPEQQRMPIEVVKDYTASDLEEEHRIAYFREDLGINLHHWHWHLVFPFEGDLAIVNKNRRGELFYYMHQQMLARYNAERLCNKLKRVRKWNNWREPIPEAYFPKLDNLVSSRAWPARVANQTLSDLNRPADQIRVDINTLENWRDRIFEAIHSGFVKGEKGEQIQLTEFEGIDILGNIIEASILSPNRAYYGDMHNLLHVSLSYIHDPDHRHLESLAIIGDSATTMRDPIFYPLHTFVDDMFQEFKATLPRYTRAQLNYDKVEVTAVQITSQGGKPNELNTFWQQSDVDMSRGMDFQPRGTVLLRFTHLQHMPFTYNITVNNGGNARKGTCRIFMAPSVDERGNPWLFSDQKNMFMEMDRFVVDLKAGQNTITRRSTESSLTIPFERTFRNLNTNSTTNIDQFNQCGCGWPQHMLVPKGTPEGFRCQLFVMISNYEGDKIEQAPGNECDKASSFCGVKDKLYPDRRSMGYPFDRMPENEKTTLQQFLTPNMRVQDVIIKFSDKVLRLRS